jgi:hypothetical protein
MRRPSDKRGREIIATCVAAGWRVREVNCGWMLMHPDGTSKVTMHTSQNEMGYRQLRSQLRRAGVEVTL